MNNQERQSQQDSIETSIAVILTKVGYLEVGFQEIKVLLEKDYVTQDEFEPIRRVVYGMVGLVLLSVLGAIVALVIRK